MAELKTPHGLIVGLILEDNIEEKVTEKPVVKPEVLKSVAEKSVVEKSVVEKSTAGDVPRRGRKKSI